MSYLPELRASLVRAAERQAGEAVAPRGRSRGWFGVAVSVGVAVAVVAVAIVLIGHGRPHGGRAATGHGVSSGGTGSPTPPQVPSMSEAQAKLIDQAQKATAAQDPACSPARHLPAYSPGSPGPALTSLLGVLRTPRTAADTLPKELFGHGPGGVEAEAIRLARTDNGTSLYIVPVAGLGFRPVPARCAGEERAALARAMRGSPAGTVRATLGVQARLLAWQQYEGRVPDAICLVELDHKRAGSQVVGAWGFSCGWGVPEIERGWAGLGTEGSPHLNEFHGIVPDGVASVTLELPRHRGTASARVVNNVFIARLPTYDGRVARIVWRSADGAVIKTIRVP